MKVKQFIALVVLFAFAPIATLLICAAFSPAPGMSKYDNKNYFTIKGRTIDGLNGSTSPLILTNCNHVRITKLRVLNSKAPGIYLYNCTDVLIDSTYITNTGSGVTAVNSTGIRVRSNQMLNMRGPFPGGNFVQFNKVYGAYNEIMHNRLEDDPSTAGAGDGISLYMSNGVAASPILVVGNWIRGGGTNTLDKGMSGIVGGDKGGSYQYIGGNILVNTGYVGIQTQGGTNISVVGNVIYSDLLPWSAGGLLSANYSASWSGNNIIAYNTVNWHAGFNNIKQRDTAYKAPNNERPQGWASNTVKAPIGPDVLPKVIITYK